MTSLSLFQNSHNLSCYYYVIIVLLQCFIKRASSQTDNTTTEDTEDSSSNEGQYTEIYLAMFSTKMDIQYIYIISLSQDKIFANSQNITYFVENTLRFIMYKCINVYIFRIIIFSILFVVVIFCLIYRIYKKRQEENGNATTTKTNGQNGSAENGMNSNSAKKENQNGLMPAEQVKFRGSMSSVENRHERVPSKPVIIAITTPKGTRHIADAFNELKKDHDHDKDSDLPEIHENEEEEYIATTNPSDEQIIVVEDQTNHSNEAQIDDLNMKTINDNKNKTSFDSNSTTDSTEPNEYTMQ